MDSRRAFEKNQAAIVASAKERYFDGIVITKIMELYNVTTAQIYLDEDREYTETTVHLIDGKLEAESIGVIGSNWAKPMLDIDGALNYVGTYDRDRMTIKFI